MIPYIRKNKENQGQIAAEKLRGEIKKIRCAMGERAGSMVQRAEAGRRMADDRGHGAERKGEGRVSKAI